MADNAQSVLRRLRELYNNPRLSLEQIADTIQNFNKGRKAEINDQGAGYRTLTPKERTAQIVGGALENIGGGGMGALGVIKSKGGNWLTGSVENALSGLKTGQPLPKGFKREVVPTDRGTVNVIDREPNGTVYNVQEFLPENFKQMESLNNWIEGPLTKYVKRDMATESDPVRALAEQGILHLPPQQQIPSVNARFLRSLHASQANPKASIEDIRATQEGVAKSDLAKQWENLSDSALDAESISSYLDPDTYFHARQEPWMQTANPDASVFRIKGQPKWLNQPEYVAGDLGFDHLTDELANALNPESGLPRNLLLTPEQMQQMGMEKAVRHVADINTWRAAQKAEADLARANSPAVQLFKDYSENNPKGLRWTELRAPEAAEGVDSRKLLEDQLRYEGDTMGHCVGGYCDKVLSGDTRIFSLRDAKGQPHVTIETRPGKDPSRLLKEDQLPPDVLADLKKRNLTSPKFMWRFDEELGRHVPEMGPFEDKIIQIKGKQNLAPKEDYLPFVQDFVKSGKWSDVGDLHNTGLRQTPKGYYTEQELHDAIVRAQGEEAGSLKDNLDWYDYMSRYNKDALNSVFEYLP